MRKNRLPKRNLGRNYHYVICDVCGKKMRAREGILINDKYNMLNGLLVCKADADEANPQQYLRAAKEQHITNPDLLRPERPDQFGFIDSPSQIEAGDISDPALVVSNPPQHLSVFGATSSQVELQWLGGEPGGTSVITGYKIERENPIGGGFATIKANTNSVALYYKDTTVSSGTEYNYRVSAISAGGTSNPSNEASVTTGT